MTIECPNSELLQLSPTVEGPSLKIQRAVASQTRESSPVLCRKNLGHFICYLIAPSLGKPTSECRPCQMLKGSSAAGMLGM